MSALSDPIAVQKLVRHFSQNTGVTVRLDYSDTVTPSTSRQADGTVKVVIPAWIKADDLGRMLAACLHESGHVEYDLAGLKEIDEALRKAKLPGWAAYLHNVVTDARIDARRCAAFAGARSLYAESFAKADALQKDVAGKRSMAMDESLRVHLTCMGALAAALGFEADAPWVSAGPFAAHPQRQPIIDLLRSVQTQRGTLLPEALRLLALLALDDSLAPPPLPASMPKPGGAGSGAEDDEPQEGAAGGAGEPKPDDPGQSGQGAAPVDDPAAVAAFDGDTAALCKKRALKGTLRDRDFQEHMRVAANRVFKGQTLRKAGATGETGPMFHTSPAAFGDAVTPFSKAELVAARTHFIGDAIRAFVESTRDVPGADDYRYRIDARCLPLIAHDPMGVLVGDTIARLPNCAVDLVLDVSGSMQSSVGPGGALSRMAALLYALKTWVEGAEAIGASGVKVGVRLFATASARHLDFTELTGIDPRALTGTAIERSAHRGRCGGGTNCRIGLEASIRDLQGEDARRKAIVFITDGAILEDDYAWMTREWPDGIALAVLAVSNDAEGLCGTGETLFKFRALSEAEVGPMLASAMRESVENQAGRG